MNREPLHYFAKAAGAATPGSVSQKLLPRELKTAAATAPQQKKKRGRAAKFWDFRGGKERHFRRSEAARRRRFERGEAKRLKAQQEADQAAAEATTASKAAAKPKTKRKLQPKAKKASKASSSRNLAEAAKPSSWTEEAVRGQVTVDCRSPPLPKRLRQAATGANTTPLGKAPPTFPRLTLRPKPAPKKTPTPPAKPPPPPEKFRAEILI